MKDFGFQHPVFPTYLDKYNAVDQYLDPSNPNYGKVTPNTPYIGQQIYCNGTTLNPGSGAGLYRWTGSFWKYIG